MWPQTSRMLLTVPWRYSQSQYTQLRYKVCAAGGGFTKLHQYSDEDMENNHLKKIKNKKTNSDRKALSRKKPYQKNKQNATRDHDDKEWRHSRISIRTPVSAFLWRRLPLWARRYAESDSLLRLCMARLLCNTTTTSTRKRFYSNDTPVPSPSL